MKRLEDCIGKASQKYVCEPEKTQWGLKQASRQSFAEINFSLCKDLVYQSCSYKLYIYVKPARAETCTMTMYFDNIFSAGTRLQSLLDLKK